MGTDIHGWVEGRSRWVEPEEIWHGVLDAGVLLDRNYEAFAHLFGVGNAENVVPLASHRGFPSLVSAPVQREIDAVLEEADDPYLDGWLNCHSATWATWEELQTVDWSAFNYSFQILRQLMEVLAQSTNFSEIRLVVWFDS